MSDVLYSKNNHIAHIIINRPDKRNALSIELARELGKVWVDFRDDDDLWVAIISGAGKDFCAGADVTQFSDDMTLRLDPGPNNTFTQSRAVMASPTQHEVWKPVIAALNGNIAGAGLWVALQCDMRIAAEDAKFSLPEPKRGISTLYSPALPSYIPRAIAYEMLLIGDSITAQRAYEICMVNKVVPNEQVIPEAMAMAERLCENGPIAVRVMKESLEKCVNLDFYTQMRCTENIIQPVFKSEDLQEGINAFREKRKPVWKGK